MKDYIILADIACDLSEDIRREIGMTDYLPGHVHIELGDDVRDISTTLDWNQISRQEFYKILSNKKARVNTAPPNIDEYYACFEKYIAQGKAIISMALSSKISGTFSFTETAAKRVRQAHPDAEIYTVDTLRMSAAFGLLVMHAHMLKKEGKSAAEVVAWLEENKRRVHQMGPVDDLIFIARRGRIGMGTAIMGSIVGVKPMGDCSSEGYVNVLTKAKGISKALDTTVRYVRETARDISAQTILVAHSDREAYAMKLRDLLKAELSPARIYVTEVFSGSGANVGPGLVGVYYLGDEIVGEMEAEKAAMARATAKQ